MGICNAPNQSKRMFKASRDSVNKTIYVHGVHIKIILM